MPCYRAVCRLENHREFANMSEDWSAREGAAIKCMAQRFPRYETQVLLPNAQRCVAGRWEELQQSISQGESAVTPQSAAVSETNRTLASLGEKMLESAARRVFKLRCCYG